MHVFFEAAHVSFERQVPTIMSFPRELTELWVLGDKASTRVLARQSLTSALAHPMLSSLKVVSLMTNDIYYITSSICILAKDICSTTRALICGYESYDNGYHLIYTSMWPCNSLLMGII